MAQKQENEIQLRRKPKILQGKKYYEDLSVWERQ